MTAELEPTGDLISILHLLKRYVRLLGLGAVLSFGAMLGIWSFAHDRFETKASFMPSGPAQPELGSAISSSLGALGGLAASSGLLGGFGGSGTQLAPKFYADLVTSDAILLQVLDTTGRNPYNYTRVYGLHNKSPERLRDFELEHLRRRIKVDLDQRTSVISVTFAGRTPQFAVAVMHSLLDAVNQFNIKTLQTTARARTKFIEAQVAAAHDSLSVSEAKLREFLQENRTYSQSPLLTFRQLQLRQDYDLKNQSVVALEGSLEKARLDEVRDTPVLTILNQPLLPSNKASYPPRTLFGIEAAIAWLIFASTFLVVRANFMAANERYDRYIQSRELTDPVSARGRSDAAAD